MDNRPWHKFYDPGVNLSPVYINMPLKDLFQAWVQKQPDKPYIFYKDEEISYQQINTMACQLANAMINAGIRKGDRVAISLSNMPEFVISVHACLKAGAIMVPTNPRYTKRELTHQYSDSGCETVICLDKYANINLELMQDRAVPVKRLIVAPNAANLKTKTINNVIGFNEFLTRGQAAEPQVDVSLSEVVLLIYTGGTTGVSKGCCITNANLIAVASGWKQMCQFFTDLNSYKVLSSTPLYHIHGFQTAINSNILIGGSMILLSEINPNNILRLINKHEPNVWPAIPTLIGELANHPDLAASKANKMQLIGCGSSPLPKCIIEKFEDIVHVPILEGYGASETSMAVTSNPLKRRKVGSVGIPYPNIDVKVVDIKTGNTQLPLGEIGELCFKGPQVVTEYWKHPEETAQSFRNGWWHSGDIGYMDEDGFIFIVDRKKDVIICCGFNVFSNEVDGILNSHPKILEAGVIGIPDPRRGETIKAYVVVKPGETLSGDEIKQFCRQYLAAYKIPTHIEFADILPRTSIQKLDRKALRLYDKAVSS